MWNPGRRGKGAGGNSSDAGATAETVELKDGGITSSAWATTAGIPAPQVRMAFARHSTSKLISAEELYDVHTLGLTRRGAASIRREQGDLRDPPRSAEYGVRAGEAGICKRA